MSHRKLEFDELRMKKAIHKELISDPDMLIDLLIALDSAGIDIGIKAKKTAEKARKLKTVKGNSNSVN